MRLRVAAFFVALALLLERAAAAKPRRPPATQTIRQFFSRGVRSTNAGTENASAESDAGASSTYGTGEGTIYESAASSSIDEQASRARGGQRNTKNEVMPPEPRRIVIVGAGPCGLFLALSLLERSRRPTSGDGGRSPEERYRVSIFERRPDPRSVPPPSRRTYPVSLQARGQAALRSVPGLLEAMEDAGGLRTRGSVLHKRRGGRGRPVDRRDPVLMMDRNSIVACMLDRLERAAKEYDDARFEASVRFECSFGGFDGGDDGGGGGEERKRRGKAIRVDPNPGRGEEPLSVPYDVLVAADGAGSAVRAALVARGKMKCEESYVPDSYRTVHVPMADPPDSGPDGGGTPEPHHLAPDRVHSFMLSGGVRMLLVKSGGDRYLHGAIMFAPDKDPIADCEDAAAVMDYFRDECPRTVGRLMTEEEAEALRGRGASRVLTVKCDCMAVTDEDVHVLLLGDAAHAVSPSMGQGCNSSLQDVLELGRALDAAAGEWDKAVPAFAEGRLPEAHAVKDLSDYSVPRTRLMWAEFFLRMTVGRWIRRWFPSLLAPMPIDIIMDGDAPYTEVLRLTRGWVDRVKRSMLQEAK